MNDATPPWRSFSSDAAAGVERPRAPDEDGGATRPPWRWLAPTLAALGGLTAGAAVAVAVVLAALPTAPWPATDEVAEPLVVGVPLDASDAAGGLGATASLSELVIDVAGAVARPGLHRLPGGSRVGDAIEAAGGFAPRADLAAASEDLNLALPLADGAKVLVPELGIDRPGPAGADVAADGRIDLNNADGAALESLPGIGPVTAGKILAARAEAPFASVDDLRTRGLVGEKVFADIADLVRVG